MIPLIQEIKYSGVGHGILPKDADGIVSRVLIEIGEGGSVASREMLPQGVHPPQIVCPKPQNQNPRCEQHDPLEEVGHDH